jgi:prolyl oligopeptidase
MVKGLVGVAIFAFAAVAHAQSPQEQATRELHALFDETWERGLREDPLLASGRGDRRYDRLWPDVSVGALQRRNDANVAALARLEQIDRELLTPAERLNYDVFRHRYRARVAAFSFKSYLFDLRAGDGVHRLSAVAEELPFATAADYDSWIARLRSIDRYLDQNKALLELGIREKRVQPRVVMDRVETALASLIAVKDPTQSAFYRAFTRIPESVPADERARLQAEGKQAVASVVLPAYRRFEQFVRERYLPASRATVGLWDTPNGVAFYAQRAQHFTTTSMTPEEIHAIGLKEVARIEQQMNEVMRQTGFKGSFAEFLVFLRTDPQFYFKSPDDLLRAYIVTAKSIEPELVKLFRKLPRTPYGVRAVPEEIAQNTAVAYYMAPAADGSRAGYYYVNLYRPEIRAKYEIEVLTAHEAVPGHHLQIALSRELEDLPRFRRDAGGDGGTIAFNEGWGLYAESLGDELGLYRDPYSKFGQLTYEMWRAVRLVVDTGIHYKHWTRDQAIAYFKVHAARSEADIANEVDRYIEWPGQALAYKIGQLKILELRARAQQQLGARFDIREFHDVVLSNGSVPLATLEQLVDEWIQRRLS